MLKIIKKFLTLNISSALYIACVLQVPLLTPLGTTLSPTASFSVFGPTAIISPTPSLPGTAGKGGLLGYFPCIVLISAGFTGE